MSLQSLRVALGHALVKKNQHRVLPIIGVNFCFKLKRMMYTAALWLACRDAQDVAIMMGREQGSTTVSTVVEYV